MPAGWPGERVFPDRPLDGLALRVGANAFPIVVVPLFGAALAAGDAGPAFAALALVTVLSALLDLRPAAPAASAAGAGA